MKSRLIVGTTTLLGISVLLVGAPNEGAARFSPDGSWLATAAWDTSPGFHLSISPTSHPREWTATLDFFGPSDPTGGGAFEDVRFTTGLATVVQTEPNRFVMTVVVYGVRKSAVLATIEYTLIGNHILTLADDGETAASSASIEVYLPAQDGDGDGLPDEGQEPLFCFEIPYDLTRVSVRPRCAI